MNNWTLQQTIFAINAVVLFFYWPLSHWFYSDFYHSMLGFAPGSYDPDFVKVIGTLGMIPVIGFAYSAFRPEKSDAFICAFAIWCFLMSATYVEVIINGQFPSREYFNSVLVFVIGLSLLPDVIKNLRRGDKA